MTRLRGVMPTRQLVLIALRERELGLADTEHLKALDARRDRAVFRLATTGRRGERDARGAADSRWTKTRHFAAPPSHHASHGCRHSSNWRRYEPGGRLCPAVVGVQLPDRRRGSAGKRAPRLAPHSLPPRHLPKPGRGNPVERCRPGAAVVEARYLLGLGALIDGRVDEAEREVAEALAAPPALACRSEVPWPTSAFSVEDFETAISRYDDALTVDPSHRDALLGRVKALSYLDRHADAMASADEMLALGEYYVGDAHYWRAWNLYRIGRYEEAEGAVGLRTVHAWPGCLRPCWPCPVARSKFEQARAEFTATLADALGQCDVRYALGGVELQFRTWTAAAGRFERALNCYEGREREVTEAAARSSRLQMGVDVRRVRVSSRTQDSNRGVRHCRQRSRRSTLATASRLVADAERAQTVPELAAPAAELLARLRGH